MPHRAPERGRVHEGTVWGYLSVERAAEVVCADHAARFYSSGP